MRSPPSTRRLPSAMAPSRRISPAFSQSCKRLRECSGYSLASAASRRIPAQSSGIVSVWSGMVAGL
jgi:hypothetical protein